jgi:hypothetical protein
LAGRISVRALLNEDANDGDASMSTASPRMQSSSPSPRGELAPLESVLAALRLPGRPLSSASTTSSVFTSVSSRSSSRSAPSPPNKLQLASSVDVFVYDTVCDSLHVLGQLVLSAHDSVADLRLAIATELAEAHAGVATGAFQLVRNDGVRLGAECDHWSLSHCLRVPLDHIALVWSAGATTSDADDTRDEDTTLASAATLAGFGGAV